MHSHLTFNLSGAYWVGNLDEEMEIANKPMIFGILEAHDGNIWFGEFDGVHRYDGKTITDFKSKEGQK